MAQRPRRNSGPAKWSSLSSAGRGRRIEGVSPQRGVGRVNAIDRELIGRGVGILFDLLARLARPLVALFSGHLRPS